MTKEAASMPTRPDRPATSGYRERLTTPWWWYPVGLAVAAVLAAEFRIADEHLTVWIPFGVMLPGACLIVWSMGRQQVVVDDTELRIREAHLPRWAVESVIPLDAGTLRKLVGRFGDPAAFVATRPWIGPGVQIILADPDDPTPYWIVSTRHPEELARALRSHRPTV
jgi:hypothetical protein